MNKTSACLMIREVAPLMQEKKSGAIVNLVSTYGFTGAAPVLAYTSAKGGLITMTKSFAKEFAPNIRVNSVAPSNVNTDMTNGVGDDLLDYFYGKHSAKKNRRTSRTRKSHPLPSFGGCKLYYRRNACG